MRRLAAAAAGLPSARRASEGKRRGLYCLVRVGLFACMVAPPNAHAPAGARRGGAPRRSSVSVGPAALSSGLVRPLSAAGAPAPSPRAPSLGPRLWCRLPLLGLVGLLRGVGRVAPAWGWWAVRAFAPLGFFPPPPRRRLHFWGVCRFAVGWWVPSCPPAWGAARRPRPPPLRAARWYTEGAQVGSTIERRRDRAGKLPARLGPVPCATSFAINRRHSVRFIGHFLLTFRRTHGMILSESVISLMARRARVQAASETPPFWRPVSTDTPHCE